MKIIKIFVLIAVLPSCDSSSKCANACKNIHKEAQAECKGDESCLRHAQSTLESCSRICRMHSNKKTGSFSTARDGTGLASLAERSMQCQDGAAKVCMELSLAYLKGNQNLERDDEKGYAYIKKACELGNALGCFSQGRMLRDGRGVQVDPKAARKLFQRACDNNEYGACTSLALGMARSRKTSARAVALFEKACTGKDGLGCMGLAAAYLHGRGVKKDSTRANELLRKSCKLGTPSACEALKQ